MRLSIRVKPGSSRTKVGGSYPLPNTDPALVVSVNAPAVDGLANAAALKALATALKIRPREIELISGATSRTKCVSVPDETRPAVEVLLGCKLHSS